jgi:hypothetical protein
MQYPSKGQECFYGTGRNRVELKNKVWRLSWKSKGYNIFTHKKKTLGLKFKGKRPMEYSELLSFPVF